MADTPPARSSSSSLTTTLKRDYNGLPVWAWGGIGIVTVAGLYLFVRRWRNAKAGADTAASPTSSAPSSGWGNVGGPLGVLPPATPGSAIPTTPTNPGTTLPGSGSTLPSSTLPTPVTSPPAAAPTSRYGIQDVLDLFARYNKSIRATASPTTESPADRVARILRDLNSGSRTIAQLAQSIAILPDMPGGASNNAAALGVGGMGPVTTPTTIAPNPPPSVVGGPQGLTNPGGPGPNEPNPGGQYGGGIASALQQVVMSGQPIFYGAGTDALQAQVTAARNALGVPNPAPALR